MSHLLKMVASTLAVLGFVFLLIPTPVEAATRLSLDTTARAAPVPLANCAVLQVQLHGASPPITHCLRVHDTSLKTIKPAIAINYCNDNDLQVFVDINYDGQAFCLTGAGTINLGDYILYCTAWWLSWNCPRQDQVRWDHQISSYSTGQWSGYFGDAWGNSSSFWSWNMVSWIGRNWNDRITTITIW